MAYPLLQFVSAAASSATLRYDFNTKNASYRTHPLGADGLDLGVPRFTGDPDSVGAEYGDRQMRFTQRVEGTKAQAMDRMSALARELLRADNWLKVQLDATTPAVYFRTYRTEPGELSLEHIETANAWDITVPLVADGFAYGERVTLSPITINNDPAAGSNPCHAILPTILGDAPAPLRIQANPSNPVYMNGYRWMLAMHSAETQQGPILWQIGGTDGWTAGTDTSASTATNPTEHTGGTHRVVSFATDANLVTRISGSAPSAPPPGRYRILTRVVRSDTSSVFSLRFGQAIGLGVYNYGPTVATAREVSTAARHATWVDLGEHTFPFGFTAPAGLEGVLGAPSIALQLGRISGAGSANIDAILLQPIALGTTRESRTLFSEFAKAGIFVDGGTGNWDGDLETFWAYSQFGIAVAVVPELAGQFLRVTPGVTNTLTLLQQVNGRMSIFGDDASDLLTATTEAALSYHPRWLYLGDS